MNELTKKLLEAGYTKDDHPDYVEWSKSWKCFEYTPKYLLHTVWETPCGLLMNGIDTYNHMSYMGIDWCPENNNPTYVCPYRKADCHLNHHYLRAGWGTGHRRIIQCAIRFSNKVYDYNRSYEKVIDGYRAMKERKRKEFFGRLKWNPEARYCSCIKWDDEKREWYAKYDPWNCAHGCYVYDICVLTGKKLDGKKGNVFYDVKTVKVRLDGSIFDGEKIVSIIKGRKMFDNPKPMAICEAFAKSCKQWILDKEISKRGLLFFNSGNEIEILNVRAEQRVSKDLLQDLRDARDGIKVMHDSDLIKAKKEAKRERRKKYHEMKKLRLQKRSIKNLKTVVSKGITIDGEEASENLKAWAKEQLQKWEIEPEYKQVSLFYMADMR